LSLEDPLTRDVVAFPSVEALHHAAAQRFAASAAQAVAARDAFRVALSGGTTPRGLYTLLATDSQLRTPVPWTAVRFFWSDERHVGPEDQASNFGMAKAAMLDPLGIAPDQIKRIRGELTDADEAARAYEQDIHQAFGSREPTIPRFDLILLGLGSDGHTASLFPDSPALQERRRLVVANHMAQLDTDRITMTVPILNAAVDIIFLVAGVDKASALKEVLHGPYDPQRLPAQLVQPPDGRVSWLIDRAAASALAG
jgi:6-phosphogluconolactonase